MNEVMEKEMISIEDMIYEIRGKQVMLDSDLAKYCGYLCDKIVTRYDICKQK